MRIVLTGAPHSGKTTLIDALARRGEQVVPEAALARIDELRRERGDAAATEWRRAHAAEFQQQIALKQLALEAAQPSAPDARVFLDRGLFDGLAYCRLAGVEAPPAVVAAARARRRYDLIVLCEIVLPFTEREGTGRTSDLPRARALERELVSVWTELGYPLLRLPSSLTPAERLARLLERTATAPARGPTTPPSPPLLPLRPPSPPPPNGARASS